MIIKGLNGKKVSLSKTGVKEILPDHQYARHFKWSDINGNKIQLHCKICSNGECANVELNRKLRAIGCFRFSPADFAKILKAAGIKTAKARKPRKR
jgi:hypothetical protein